MATEFELQVLQELGDIKKEMAAGGANLASLNQRLFQSETGVLTVMHSDIKSLKDANLSVRVQAMEDDLRDHKKWQNIKLIAAMIIQAAGSMVGIHYKGHP